MHERERKEVKGSTGLKVKEYKEFTKANNDCGREALMKCHDPPRGCLRKVSFSEHQEPQTT